MRNNKRLAKKKLTVSIKTTAAQVCVFLNDDAIARKAKRLA